MPVLEAGGPAPDFTCATNSGDSVSLSDYADKTLILWWYPKASTPG